MAEGAERRAQVAGEGGIAPARRPTLGGHRQNGCLRYAIEVKAGVQVVVAREPLGSEGHLIGSAVGDAAPVGVGRLEVIVGRFGGARGHEVQDVVGRVVGVCLHEAVAMIAQNAPGGEPCLEGAVLQQLDRGGIRRFDDLQVIEQTLAGVQEAELEFIPHSWAEDAGGDDAIGVIAPARPGGFVTGSPSLGLGVIGPGVAEFEARSPAVGITGPAPSVKEMDLVGDIAGGIRQNDRIIVVGVFARKRTHDSDAGIVGLHVANIVGYDQVAARREGRSGKKAESDATAERPAGQVNGVAPAVEEFHPGFGRILRGRCMVHNFVNDDVALEHEEVRSPRRRRGGITPGAGAIRPAGRRHAADDQGIEHIRGSRPIEEEAVARNDSEAKGGLGDLN